jgi:hypothetical protein
MYIILVLFSVGAINALAPLIVIVILIAAGAGAMRGWSFFNLFGLSTLFKFTNVQKGTITKASMTSSKKSFKPTKGSTALGSALGKRAAAASMYRKMGRAQIKASRGYKILGRTEEHERGIRKFPGRTAEERKEQAKLEIEAKKKLAGRRSPTWGSLGLVNMVVKGEAGMLGKGVFGNLATKVNKIAAQKMRKAQGVEEYRKYVERTFTPGIKERIDSIKKEMEGIVANKDTIISSKAAELAAAGLSKAAVAATASNFYESTLKKKKRELDIENEKLKENALSSPEYTRMELARTEFVEEAYRKHEAVQRRVIEERRALDDKLYKNEINNREYERRHRELDKEVAASRIEYLKETERGMTLSEVKTALGLLASMPYDKQAREEQMDRLYAAIAPGIRNLPGLSWDIKKEQNLIGSPEKGANIVEGGHKMATGIERKSTNVNLIEDENAKRLKEEEENRKNLEEFKKKKKLRGDTEK